MVGSKLITFLMIDMASEDKKRGYLTSSLTILSNTSSSSSPGNGDFEREREREREKP